MSGPGDLKTLISDNFLFMHYNRLKRIIAIGSVILLT